MGFPKCKTAACTKTDELDSVQFGNDIANKQDRVYAEKALIGYRWYHAKGISVSYPFGFGLFAYGTAEMKYSKAAVQAKGSGVSVTVELRHTGPRAGHDVPQLYLSFPSSIPGDANSKPEWVLKGFSKKSVKPNETVMASFHLTERDLSYWDDAPGKSLWVCARGEFRVCVGANARDAVDPRKGSCTSFMSPCSPEPLHVAMKTDPTAPVKTPATQSLPEPLLVAMKNDATAPVKTPAKPLAPAVSALSLVSFAMVAAGVSLLGQCLRRRVSERTRTAGENSRQLLRQSDGREDGVE